MWHRAGKKAKYWHNFCSCWGLCGLDTCISKAGLFYVSDQSLDGNLTFLFLAFQDSLSATSRPHANSIMGEDYYPRNSILFETGNILVESRKCCYSLKDKSCSRRTVLEDPGPATSSEQSLRLMTVWVSRSSPADSLEVFFTIRRTIRATHIHAQPSAYLISLSWFHPSQQPTQPLTVFQQSLFIIASVIWMHKYCPSTH